MPVLMAIRAISRTPYQSWAQRAPLWVKTFSGVMRHFSGVMRHQLAFCCNNV
jgi:hypothetical protein